MRALGLVALILGIVCVVSFSLAAALIFANGDSIVYGLDNPEYSVEVNNIKNISVEGIEDIVINMISEDVEIETYNGEEIVFNLSGYYSDSPNRQVPELSLSLGEGVLIVEVERGESEIFAGFNFEDLDLYVKIPRSYSGDLDLSTVSGDVEILDMELNDLHIETVSGDFELENVKINSGNYESVSGDFELIDFVFVDSLRIESISGDSIISFLGEPFLDLRFDSVSGDLSGDLKNLYSGDKKVFVSTVSGDLEIN